MGKSQVCTEKGPFLRWKVLNPYWVMTKVVGLPKETRAETESTALDDIDPPTQMTISMEVDPLQERVPV